MNSTMSLIENGCFQVEGHRISIRHSTSAIFACEAWGFRPVIGAELYGILRRNTPEEVVLFQQGDSNYLQICYAANWNFGSTPEFEYFRVTNAEMDKFLFHYCNIPRGKIDWKEQGF